MENFSQWYQDQQLNEDTRIPKPRAPQKTPPGLISKLAGTKPAQALKNKDQAPPPPKTPKAPVQTPAHRQVMTMLHPDHVDKTTGLVSTPQLAVHPDHASAVKQLWIVSDLVKAAKDLGYTLTPKKVIVKFEARPTKR
jgi:hypothetical protein